MKDMGEKAKEFRRTDETEDRIRSLEGLAERSRFLEAVVSGVAEPILVIDKDYTVILKNPSAGGFWGVPEKDGVKCHEVSHGLSEPCDKKGCPCPLKEVIETGKSVTVTHEHKSAEGMRFFEILASPLFGPAGDVEGIIETARDITERKIFEEKLIRSEERFHSLYENSLDAIILTSPEGEYYAANPAACRMFGYTEEELVAVGRNGVVSQSDPHLPKYLEDRKKFGMARAELELIKKDGAKFPSEVSASTFLDADGKTRVSVIIRDISVRKALERQKNDFLAMVTHDLKSPLTAIIGYAHLLGLEGEKNRNDNIVSMAGAIRDSSERIVRLVADFLTISRMQDEKFEIRKALSDSREIILNTRNEFSLLANQKGLSLSVDLPDKMPKVLVDRPQIERVLENIVQNAINYTPSGGSIIIGAEETVRDNAKYLKIMVSDTGKGVSREEREKIFSKYYRSPKTAGIKGSGLGLTIAKAVTETHGGWIELESEPGRGSVFTVFLPLAD